MKWNNCKDETLPNPFPFIEVYILPCKIIEKGTEIEEVISGPEVTDPEFWSIYGRYPDGTSSALHDDTYEEVLNRMYRLTTTFKITGRGM